MIDPIIFTRTHTATFLLRAQGRMASEKEKSKGRKATLKDLDFERIFPKEHGGACHHPPEARRGPRLKIPAEEPPCFVASLARSQTAADTQTTAAVGFFHRVRTGC